jgi:hypothetical protein
MGFSPVGVASCEAEQALAEADGKYLYPNTEVLGRGVVPEFMNKDHEAKHNSHVKNRMKDGQELRHIPKTNSQIPIKKWP